MFKLKNMIKLITILGLRKSAKLFALSLFFITPFTFADGVAGETFNDSGVVWQGDYQIVDQNYSAGTGYQVDYYSVATTVSSPTGTWGEVDGHYGIVLAPGIVAVLDGSSAITGKYYSNSTTVLSSTVNFYFNSNPLPSATNTQPELIQYNDRTTMYNIHSNQSYRTKFVTVKVNIKGGIYISPSAKAGTYQLPEIVVRGGAIGVSLQPFGPAGTFTYIDPLKCSIAAPPTVAFGTVNVTGVGAEKLLATKQQGIDVTCTSTAANAVTDKMTVSFKGDYVGSDWNRLDVKNNGGNSIAYIRGRYLDGSGSCQSDSANEVGFNEINGVKTQNNVGVGALKIPITWSLCSNGSGLLGEASAQATVNINWN